MMRYLAVSSFSSLVVLSFFAVSAIAEPDAPAGRLPDGRAYRIDQQGYELVDHVAELEVTVDDLQRQIDALEGELSDKRRIIRAMEEGKDPDSIPRVKEEDLLPSVRRARRGPGQSNCEALIVPLDRKITLLQKEINEQARKRVACEEQTKGLEERIQQLEAKFAGAVDAANQQREASREVLNVQTTREAQLVSEINELESKLALLNETVSRQNDEIAARQAEISKRDSEIASLNSKLSAAPKQLAQASRSNSKREYVRARLSSSEAKTRSRASDADIQVAKKEFSTSLRRIQKKILRRKDLWDKARSGNKQVSIQIRPLKTTSGVSLDSLRSQVAKLSNSSNTRAIRSGLNSIESILDDDISVLKRLLKI